MASQDKDERKVLILSDRNALARDAECLYLETMGFRVHAVGCVNQFLAEEPRCPDEADLIVVDYCMDCLRGPSGCIAALRKTFAGSSILMLCADTRVAADSDIAALVDAFLYKPTSPQALVRAVSDLAGAGPAPCSHQPAGGDADPADR